MTDSPSTAEGAVRVSVSSNGARIDGAIPLISVAIQRAVNAIPAAQLVFSDGDLPTQDFPLSNQDIFKPGAEISISAGYGDSEDILFKGIVVKHSLKISGENNTRLVIECRDKAVRMTVGRNNANFINQKDSDIISKLVADYGFAADVAASESTFNEIVQYGCTDWDFVLARADVNGFLVIATNGTISVKPPQTDGAASLKVTYGQDLMEFHADIDARTQLTSVTSVAWDSKTQSVLKGSAAKAAPLNAQDDLDSAQLAAVAGPAEFFLRTSAPLEKAVLGTWAKAQQVKARLARIRGSMKFQGSAKAKVGQLINVAGVGNRFSGNVFVSKVNHEIADGNWITEVEFGLAPDWFTARPDVSAPAASNWIPSISCLQIGVVKQLDGDPEGENRVQVSVPVMQAEPNTIWARLAKFYGSSGFGAFFIPEIGDEVVLGNINGDPSFPVILGSLYSSAHTPPYPLSAGNNAKAIVTRSMAKIEFDDDKKTIAIQTPANNKVVLSDEGESIVLQDQNGNKVHLSPNGIVMDSAKDIRISARGTIKIDAVGEIGITSEADIKSAGLNVICEAKVALTAKGAATAELSAAGQTVVKGAMVLIN